VTFKFTPEAKVVLFTVAMIELIYIGSGMLYEFPLVHIAPSAYHGSVP
jgi:hypothetical protein